MLLSFFYRCRYGSLQAHHVSTISYNRAHSNVLVSNAGWSQIHSFIFRHSCTCEIVIMSILSNSTITMSHIFLFFPIRTAWFEAGQYTTQWRLFTQGTYHRRLFASVGTLWRNILISIVVLHIDELRSLNAILLYLCYCCCYFRFL